jgi:ankyrin repeat protein
MGDKSSIETKISNENLQRHYVNKAIIAYNSKLLQQNAFQEKSLKHDELPNDTLQRHYVNKAIIAHYLQLQQQNFFQERSLKHDELPNDTPKAITTPNLQLFEMCDDIIIQIFLHVDLRTIHNIRLTSTKWNFISTKNLVWEYHLAQRFGCPKKDDKSFEELYKQYYQKVRKMCTHEASRWAISNQCVSMFKTLFKEHGINLGGCVNSQNLSSLLRSASKYGLDEAVEILLESKICPVDETTDAFSPLCIATQEGHLSTMKILIKYGANLEYESNRMRTPLHLACGKGNLEIIKYLIGVGANINATDLSNYTPLYLGSKNNRLDIVDYLLSKGASHMIKSNGCGPLHIASEHGHLDIINKLLCYGADPNEDCTVSTPIFIASQNNHWLIVEKLLEAGGDPTIVSKSGYSPFHIACEVGNYQVVKILMETKRININKVGPSGTTPLYEACKNGHTETVLILVESPDLLPDIVTTGPTPLCKATECGYSDICGILLAQTKCDPNLSLPGYLSALYYACRNGDLEAMKLLVSKGADLSFKDGSKSNLLYIAIQKNRDKVISWLIDIHPLLLFEENDTGTTPFDIACMTGNKIIQNLMKDFFKNHQDKLVQHIHDRKNEEMSRK